MQPGAKVDLCVHANVFPNPCVISGSNATATARAKTLLVSYRPLAHKNALLLVKLVSRALGTAASTPSGQRATTSHLHNDLDRACRIQAASSRDKPRL